MNNGRFTYGIWLFSFFFEVIVLCIRDGGKWILCSFNGNALFSYYSFLVYLSFYSGLLLPSNCSLLADKFIPLIDELSYFC